LKKQIKILLELSKFRITSFVSLTTGFGFIAATGALSFNLIAVLSGVLLIACGSAALNHFQERKTDALMDRTKFRPIPSGRITPNDVIIVSLIMIISGSTILYLSGGIIATLIALSNLIWYNVVYTMLKRKSAFAIIPGSLVGAIPPAVGWVSGGGLLTDPQLFIICFFFFIWQIPHFWLLLLVFDEDYQKAGFPTLTQIFDKHQLIRITFMWIIATGVTAILIPLFGLVKQDLINIALFFSGIWLTWNAFKLLSKTENNLIFSFAFRSINLFVLTVVTLVSIDKLVF
jgi:protoheme IX farnesyltransferase